MTTDSLPTPPVTSSSNGSTDWSLDRSLLILAPRALLGCSDDDDSPVSTDAPVATDAPVETEALVSDDLRVRQVHEASSLPPALFDVYPGALSGIVVTGDLPDGCRMVAVHDANNDGVLGPDDEVVFGAGLAIEPGVAYIPIDRGGRYFLVKDGPEGEGIPVGTFVGEASTAGGASIVVDGTSVILGGVVDQPFEAVGLSPTGDSPASYNVDFNPDNEIMTAS